jgi:diaminobutyrate-2-oxoglutarate transaminase
MHTFERLESEVRSYCRDWPAVFDKASGATVLDRDGKDYLDFFAGAGALNYGHNPEQLRGPLMEYLADEGVTHSLDTATVAKEQLLLTMEEVLFAPRGLEYKVMFPGPTGTNAVESALKLARKVTGRETVIGFTNAFHGMTLGSLAVSGNSAKRAGAGVSLPNAVSMPFASSFGDEVDTLDQLEFYLTDDGSGVDVPAAVIVETIQAEGGVNVASPAWIRRLGQICREHGIVFVIDDIQVGCGRTGPFFSFEDMDLEFPPDLVCLSKSLSGYGLPFSVVLIDPRLDVWDPGEHNGTFRGFNPAFITAEAALREWWSDNDLTRQVRRHGEAIAAHLEGIVEDHPRDFQAPRGRGLVWGLPCTEADLASAITGAAFERGLIIETAGAAGEVVKLLPPLTIDDMDIKRGLRLLSDSVVSVLRARKESMVGAAAGK